MIDIPVTIQTEKPVEEISITISDEAHWFIKKVSAEPENTGKWLTLEVKAGGCAGYQYSFFFKDYEEMDDNYLIVDGPVAILTDIQSARLIDGSTIDFIKAGLVSNLVISNPNKAACGCGQSFS